MYEPEVTIITPTYNIVDEGLTDDFNLLITLLHKQTYPYIEHLIIDNASTDETLMLLKEYKNSGLLNFYSEKDRGKFDAYNKGILRAKGQYLAFVSCDDFYQDVTGIMDVINVMEEEDADFAFFPVYCVHPEGYVFLFMPSILNVFQVPPCPRQALIVRKDVMNELNGFDEKFKMTADYDLIIRLFLNEYRGVFFDGNIMTCKVGKQIMTQTVQCEAETKHIFYKNYKNMYSMTDEVLDRMVGLSEMPKPLLEQLVKKFPEEDYDLFYERYEEMYNIRKQARANQR